VRFFGFLKMVRRSAVDRIDQRDPEGVRWETDHGSESRWRGVGRALVGPIGLYWLGRLL
jgi:hypothetical protein